MAADKTGDDLTVGETNHAQDGTELVGNVNADGSYGNDYVFQAFASPLLGFTDAIRGIANSGGNGVFGTSRQASPSAGVLGRLNSPQGAGVRGENDQGPAVHGVSAPTKSSPSVGTGVRGEAGDPDNIGVEGVGVEASQ